MQNYDENDTAAAGFASSNEQTTNLTLVTREQIEQRLENASAEDQGWLARQDFNGEKGDIAWLTDGSCLIGWDGKDNIAALGHLPMQLPEGSYKFTHSITDLQAVGWGLGAYQFDRYKDASRAPARLLLDVGNDLTQVMDKVCATLLTRDLINTPSQDCLLYTSPSPRDS